MDNNSNTLSKWYLFFNLLSFFSLIISYFTPWFIVSYYNYDYEIEEKVRINVFYIIEATAQTVFLNIFIITSIIIHCINFIMVLLEIKNSKKIKRIITTLIFSIVSNISILISMVMGFVAFRDFNSYYYNDFSIKYSVGIGFIIVCFILTSIVSILSFIRYLKRVPVNLYTSLSLEEEKGLLKNNSTITLDGINDNNNNNNLQLKVLYQEQLIINLQNRIAQIENLLSNNAYKNANEKFKELQMIDELQKNKLSQNNNLNTEYRVINNDKDLNLKIKELEMIIEIQSNKLSQHNNK